MSEKFIDVSPSEVGGEPKYHFYIKNHSLFCDRYGEEWRNFIGDGAILGLFLYTQDLIEENIKLRAVRTKEWAYGPNGLGECHIPKEQPEPEKPVCPTCGGDMQVQNLLAIVHGDGGHHTAEVGLEQSIKDAHTKYYQLRERIYEYEGISHLPSYTLQELLDEIEKRFETYRKED